MAARRCIALLLALGAPSGALAQPQTYRLDPAHSFVHFELAHFGTSTIRGRFGPIQGFVTIDRTAVSGETGLTIDIKSLDTGLAIFDARIKQADLLAADAHPQAWFVARRFRFEGERVAEVRGEFTLRGQSVPLSLRAQRFGCHQHPMLKREVCGGDFEGELSRGAFGMNFGAPFIGDRVRLMVQVEGIRD